MAMAMPTGDFHSRTWSLSLSVCRLAARTSASRQQQVRVLTLLCINNNNNNNNISPIYSLASPPHTHTSRLAFPIELELASKDKPAEGDNSISAVSTHYA